MIGPTLRVRGGCCLGTKWEFKSREEAHGRENWVQERGVSSLSRGSVLREPLPRTPCGHGEPGPLAATLCPPYHPSSMSPAFLRGLLCETRGTDAGEQGRPLPGACGSASCWAPASTRGWLSRKTSCSQSTLAGAAGLVSGDGMEPVMLLWTVSS